MMSRKSILHILSVAILVMLATCMHGQSGARRVLWGAFMGPEMADQWFWNFSQHMAVPARPGFTAGGTLAIPIGNHFSFQTGLTYSFEHFRMMFQEVYYPAQYYPSGVVEPTTSVLKVNYHDLYVPALMRWHLQSLNHGFYVTLGPEAWFTPVLNFTLKSTTASGAEVFTYHQTRTHMRPALSAIAMMGYRLPLNDDLSLTFEPYFRMGIFWLSNPSAHHVNFGLRVGLAF